MKKILITSIALGLTAPYAFAADEPTNTNEAATVRHSETAQMQQRDNRDGNQQQQRTQGTQRNQATQDNQTAQGERSQSWDREQTQDRSHADMKDKQSWDRGDKQGKADMSSVKLRSQDELRTMTTSERLMNAEIQGQDGESIGSISDVVIENGEIDSVVVGVGGILGFGETLVSIPYDSLERTDQQRGQMQQGEQSQEQEQISFRLNVTSAEFTRSVENDQPTNLQGERQARTITSDELSEKKTAGSIVGRDVLGSDNQTIGTVSAIAFQQNGSANVYIEVEDMGRIRGEQMGQSDRTGQGERAGENRGMENAERSGEQLAEVPYEQLESFEQDGEEAYRLNVGQEEFAQALRGQSGDTARAQPRQGEGNQAWTRAEDRRETSMAGTSQRPSTTDDES